jgi:Family of unknown function (DUF5996)
VTRFWRALLSVEAVLREFRARFPGKTPPVQLWWGSFDLALTLYTGKPVTPPEGADTITRIGGDAEQFCAGFWPGDYRLHHPAFFAYLYPKPDDVEDARWWNPDLGELILPTTTCAQATTRDTPCSSSSNTRSTGSGPVTDLRVPRSARLPATMERLWSPAGATSGNQSQMGLARKRLK